MNITVIGLGKLGLPLATHLGMKGHLVLGFDTNKEHRDAVRRWLSGSPCPIRETGMDDVYRSIVDSHPLAVADEPEASEVNVIIVPTPSTRGGAFDNSHVLEAIDALAPTLRGKCPGAAVVLVSTVSPRSCPEQIVPYLEGRLGGCNGVDFDFYYNPEFIALGSVLYNLEHPDILLCGVGSAMMQTRGVAFGMMLGLYAGATHGELTSTDGADVEVHIMSYVEAELAKLALNCAVTQKICFANAIGAVAESLGADPRRVLEAVGGDRRIGRLYLRPGTPFGGPCFPRDGAAMQSAVCKDMPNEAAFLGAAQAYRGQQLFSQERLCDAIKVREKVAILGVAYKPGTDFCEESASLRLEYVLRRNARAEVVTWDPLARPGDPYEVCAGASAVCVMHPGIELDWARVACSLAPAAIIWAPWGEPTPEQVGGAPVRFLGRSLR